MILDVVFSENSRKIAANFKSLQRVTIDAEVIENVDVAPDFSEGDHVYTAPDGYLVKSATVKKPDTLLPENIKKDVTIAGVVGVFNGTQTELPSAEEVSV